MVSVNLLPEIPSLPMLCHRNQGFQLWVVNATPTLEVQYKFCFSQTLHYLCFFTEMLKLYQAHVNTELTVKPGKICYPSAS